MTFIEFEKVVTDLCNRPDVEPEMPVKLGVPEELQPHVRAQELVDSVFHMASLLHGRVVARVNGATVDYTLLPRTGTTNGTQQPEATVDNLTPTRNGKKRHGTDVKALRRAEQSAFAIRTKRARRIHNFNLFPGKVRSAY